MFNEYEPETLENLHKVELEILREIIRICDANKIEYFIIAGTLIGAIRHKGFIPWDDDIDIGMTRKNYDNFLKLLPEKLGSDYYFINAENSKKFLLINSRIMKKGTAFHENTFKNIKMDIPLGIFVDIFPFDNIPDDSLARKVQTLEISFLCKLLILKYIPFPYLRIGGLKAVIARIICCVIHYLLVVFHIPRRAIVRACRNVMTRYVDIDTGMVSNLTDTNPLEEAMTRDVLLPLKKVEFEGMQLSTVNDHNAYLTYGYGDYMQIPPVEQRKMHKPYRLNFGDEVNGIEAAE